MSKKTVLTIAVVILSLPLMFYSWRISLRPPRTEIEQSLAAGIDYQRQIYSQPRPYIAHIVTIDLTNQAIAAFVTPIVAQSHQSEFGRDEYSALTTSSFVRQFDLKLAVNGSFFYPFAENTPWSFYPHQKDRAIALGENVVRGKRYGKKEKLWNVLCLNQKAEISLTQTCPESTYSGIAGRELLVKDGKLVTNDESKAYARTSVAVNRQGTKLWLIVVDGKQLSYSEGATLTELAEIAINLGGDRAINLDGGGSTTLVARQNERIKILNAPIHTKIPMRERPVANHLGFR